MGSIPGLGRSPGGGNANPLQYSCLENPMDRGAWWATIHRDAKSQTWLNMHVKQLLPAWRSLFPKRGHNFLKDFCIMAVPNDWWIPWSSRKFFKLQIKRFQNNRAFFSDYEPPPPNLSCFSYRILLFPRKYTALLVPWTSGRSNSPS